jgi:F-type H+-transporting ATPase subunit alpha
VRDKFSDLLDQINASGEYNDEIEASLKKAVEDFKRSGAY